MPEHAHTSPTAVAVNSFLPARMTRSCAYSLLQTAEASRETVRPQRAIQARKVHRPATHTLNSVRSNSSSEHNTKHTTRCSSSEHSTQHKMPLNAAANIRRKTNTKQAMHDATRTHARHGARCARWNLLCRILPRATSLRRLQLQRRQSLPTVVSG